MQHQKLGCIKRLKKWLQVACGLRGRTGCQCVWSHERWWKMWAVLGLLAVEEAI